MSILRLERREMDMKLLKSLRRAKEWLMDYAYLVTLGAVLAVIAGSALYAREVKAKQEQDVQAAAQAPELAGTPEPTARPMPTLAPLEAHYFSPKPGGSTVYPVSGDVIRAYDGVTPVSWAALSCMKVHAGLDLAGEAEEDVLCVMDGVVAGTARDELWGWRVAVDQTDGQRMTYAGLLMAAVQAGESVTRGQALGTLMESIPCEAELGTHLHLELARGEEARDPQTVLPQSGQEKRRR